MTTKTTGIIKPQHSLTGGLKLPCNKSRSAEVPLQTCPLPEQLRIPLNMHLGADAIAIVKPGDRIVQGQSIAEADSPISAYIHSPVNGVIADICNKPVANRSGIEETVIIIDCEPSQELGYGDSVDWSNQTPEQLLETVRLAGIVGLGGAGFPSHQKIKNGRLMSDTLLLNGAECEPYISCDDRTMRDYSLQIIEGAVILSRILDCSMIQIAIEDNKPEAIKAMLGAVENYQKQLPDAQLKIEVIEIPTLYPSGGERQLIEIITGKQVPSGSLPSELGYTVQNVSTILAIQEAVVFNKPLVDRIVTVTGDAVSRPGNYRVTIGTSIRHLLQFAGCDENLVSTIVHGGPMMGIPLASTDRPVSKITNCIIAATAEEFPEPQAERPCIRCGKCAEVCPASLLPQQLLWYSRSGELNKAEEYKLNDCIECGACAYVCPSEIPLVDYYRFTKGELRSRQEAKRKAENSKRRYESRNQRLEERKLEKQRLREERARKAAEKKQLNTVDPKKQAVADALARVQAKKKAKAEAERQNKDETDV